MIQLGTAVSCRVVFSPFQPCLRRMGRAAWYVTAAGRFALALGAFCVSALLHSAFCIVTHPPPYSTLYAPLPPHQVGMTGLAGLTHEWMGLVPWF